MRRAFQFTAGTITTIIGGLGIVFTVYVIPHTNGFVAIACFIMPGLLSAWILWAGIQTLEDWQDSSGPGTGR